MQAIAISKTGGLEVLEKQTVPFPKQEPDQIVVKVSILTSRASTATNVNYRSIGAE